MNKEAAKLEIIIEQCDKHAQRLDYAFGQIAFLLPFTSENVGRLKDE